MNLGSSSHPRRQIVRCSRRNYTNLCNHCTHRFKCINRPVLENGIGRERKRSNNDCSPVCGSGGMWDINRNLENLIRKVRPSCLFSIRPKKLQIPSASFRSLGVRTLSSIPRRGLNGKHGITLPQCGDQRTHRWHRYAGAGCPP